MARRPDPRLDPRSPTTPVSTRHRSGAVAQMLRMPVATLRVWERRYAVTNAGLSPGGQRLYSADDVRRLALLKQLTDRGHAIGSLAALDMAQLQAVAATHAQARSIAQRPAEATPGRAMRTLRLGVVGAALGARLHEPALVRQVGRPLELVGPFADLAQAAAAAQRRRADAWLLHEPQLHPGWLASLEAAAPALAPAPKAVLYGYAADAVCDSLAAAGVTLLREPQPDAVLAQWLRSWVGGVAAPAAPPSVVPADAAPRRWDDAALAGVAAQSTTVACECPRHVAELLMQLSRFETYSAQCAHRNPADAELHAGLLRVTSQARASFETALEQVALHEGLLLPPSQ